MSLCDAVRGECCAESERIRLCNGQCIARGAGIAEAGGQGACRACLGAQLFRSVIDRDRAGCPGGHGAARVANNSAPLNSGQRAACACGACVGRVAHNDAARHAMGEVETCRREKGGAVVDGVGQRAGSSEVDRIGREYLAKARCSGDRHGTVVGRGGDIGASVARAVLYVRDRECHVACCGS